MVRQQPLQLQSSNARHEARAPVRRLYACVRKRSFQPARYDTYACGCGNGIAQKLLASTRSGRFDLAL